MTPLPLSRFWHRRLYEVVFLLSLAVLGLYFVPVFTHIAAVGLFDISILVAIGAGIAATASLILYFASPKEPSPFLPLAPYLLFTATAGLLVLQTGGTGSPFIALWMLVAFFSGIFAVWGAVPIASATGVFVALEYLDGNFNAGLVALVAFTSLLPMAIGLIIWRHKEDTSETAKNTKTLASELSEVANKSEIIINAIGDGVMAIDSQGVIQLINPAAQEILGWAKQDALMLNYKSVLKLTDEQDHELDQSQDPIMQVLNTNQQVRSKTLVIKTKSNKKVMTSLVVSPIGQAGSGVIAVFRDITKEKTEEREQAEFISTASHEMRTPVASIEGYLGLALNPNTAQIDQKARDFIMKAHEAAQHLGRLFQDLLDVSKSEDGRMANLPKVVDIVPFTETVVQGLAQKAADKGLGLIFKPTANRAQKTIAPVYYVHLDNDHIREVLDNLIENGIKYTPKGSVTVDVQGSDDKVIISVKDSGLGIPAEDVPHLFQKFYRVNNADRQEIGGTGLGLYLSRRLVESMQGRLWVESVHGQGSTFFVELPRIDSQKAEELKQQQAAQPVPVQPQPAAPVPAAPVIPATPVTPVASASSAQPAPAAASVQPAKNVPRGESLTRDQIAAKVRQLEAMARQNTSVPPRPGQPPAPPQA